jgi:hypothetical protein
VSIDQLRLREREGSWGEPYERAMLRETAGHQRREDVMEGYDRAEPDRAYAHGTSEAKQEIEPLREVLARAVTRLEKELEMLAVRISPVLRMDEPRGDPMMTAVSPHSSELAGNAYALHRIADDIGRLASRVEL